MTKLKFLLNSEEVSESNAKVNGITCYPMFTILIPVFCFIGCWVIVVRNSLYHIGMLDTGIYLANSRVEIPAWVITALFLLLIVMFIWEEFYKKFIYVRVYSSKEIVIYRFFKKHTLYPGDVKTIKVDKLFSRFGLANEVILLDTGNDRFVVSQLYIKRYEKLKQYLNSQFKVTVL